MANLTPLTHISGFIGAALVDADSSLVLGTAGGGALLDLDVASAGNSEVVRAKRKTMDMLKLKTSIEDILITLGDQYHLIRPLEKNAGVFLYLALSRAQANLGMARLELKAFEKTVEV